MLNGSGFGCLHVSLTDSEHAELHAGVHCSPVEEGQGGGMGGTPGPARTVVEHLGRRVQPGGVGAALGDAAQLARRRQRLPLPRRQRLVRQ